jgi:two-component system phosphate regulon response regulator PhoB
LSLPEQTNAAYREGVEALRPQDCTVLVVDDEADLRSIVEFNLKQAGYQTRAAGGGTEALESCGKSRPDIVILDLNMPDLNGIEVCRALRAAPETRDLPILMLTARGSEIDRVVGFEVGADDYVTKPFVVRELVLRVDALRRRLSRALRPTAPKPAERLKSGRIELDVEDYVALVDGKEVALTLLEFRLLRFLMEGRGRVRTRESMLAEVWGYSSEVETRTVDTHVKRLRDKLGSAGEAIETVRGVGYRLAGE